jgi:hypothetical protein
MGRPHPRGDEGNFGGHRYEDPDDGRFDPYGDRAGDRGHEAERRGSRFEHGPQGGSARYATGYEDGPYGWIDERELHRPGYGGAQGHDRGPASSWPQRLGGARTWERRFDSGESADPFGDRRASSGYGHRGPYDIVGENGGPRRGALREYGDATGAGMSPYGGESGRMPDYGGAPRGGTLTPSVRGARGPKGWTRSDERIRDDICGQLYDDPRIDSSEVTVDVEEGKVVLQGSVEARFMKHAIEDLVDRCPGVKDIDNRIRVARDGARGGPEEASSDRATEGARRESSNGEGNSPSGTREKR